jgi:hypothetical protein
VNKLKLLVGKLSYEPVLLVCGVLGAVAIYLFTTYAPGIDADLVQRLVASGITLVLAGWAREKVTPVSTVEQQKEKDDALQRIKEFQDLAKQWPGANPNLIRIIDSVDDVVANVPVQEHAGKTFGFVRSPADHRDHIYSLTAKPVDLPYRWDWNEEFGALPVYDQGQVPACVGFSLAALKTAQERFETQQVLPFDGNQIYKQVALPEGGAYIRDGLEFLRKTGIAVEGQNEAFRIHSYAGIDPKDHYHVKHAIYKWGAVSVGFDVPASFTDGGGKEFSVHGDGDEIVGGHAILAVGFSTTGVILHNSWGTSWGDYGRAVVTWEFWDKYVSEVWSVVDAKDRPGLAQSRR